MKNRGLTACLALAIFAVSGGAAAGDDFHKDPMTPNRRAESPQHFAFELRFSPYSPDVDGESSLGGKTPFADTFGSMKRLLISAEMDWQAYRIPYVGTIGPGFSVGYTEFSDKSFTLGGARSEEETSLLVYPMTLNAVLRVDQLWRRHSVPFVPYAKAGLAYALWRGTNPGGTSVVGDGVTAKGATFGTNFAFGVAFALDFLDEYASRNLDNAIGINNSYLFAEVYALTLNGLGQSSAMQLGANTWALGLAFEF
jgi:hypothetical protein